MNWDEIVEKIASFWNMKVPIIGFTVGAIVIGFLVIISKTSWGRKAINWCKKKIGDFEIIFKEANDTYKRTLEEKDALLKLKDEIIEKMKQEYDTKLAIVQNQRNEERNVIIAIGQCINNVKVKKIIEDYISKPVAESVSEYTQEIEENYEDKYKELLKRIEVLENERKETIDSNPVEETI